MKKTWMLAIALLMLVLPAAGMAQGLPDFLSAAGEGIAQGAEAVSQSMAQELELTMTADGARIDFLTGSVGIEVKKSRPERARLLRQVDKYLACAEVDALIVVSQRAMSLPAACRGKPVILFTLNRLWGVSLP